MPKSDLSTHQKIFKVTRMKRYAMYRSTKKRSFADFSFKTMLLKKEWSTIIKILKEKENNS